MSEVIPCTWQTDMPEDRRSGKLLKQMEADDAEKNQSTLSRRDTAVSAGILAPNGQAASSPSGSSPDVSLPKVTMQPPNIRCKTLIRGHALEGNSPPPETFMCQIPQNGDVPNGHLLVGIAGDSVDVNGKLKELSHDAKDFLLASHKISNDSGNSTLDQNDDASDTSMLSRDSSLENASTGDVYKDSSGVNIPQFMRETLQKSPKDKKTILALEEQLLSFINNNGVQVHKMGEMTSYDRMIVHRLAAYLGLEHNVDSTGKCMILNRTENTRSVRLSEMILFKDTQLETKTKILLKKQPASFDEKHGRGSNKAQFGSARAKSLEERQEIYNEARERIFKNDENQCEEGSEPNNFLSVNFVPQLQQQQHRSHDISASNGHQPMNWPIEESGSNVPHKELSNTSYNPVPSHLTSSLVLAPVAAPSDLRQISSATLDTAPSTATQLQPHGNPEGSLYHFDTTCPPPFVVRPPPETTPTGQIVYQNDSMSDITTRFAGVSVDQGNEAFAMGVPGQYVPMMSAFMLHPQSAYTSAYPSQIPQGQYFIAPSPASSQQPVRYVAIPYPPGQNQQFLHGTAVDGQGQTTVPMPAVGVPGVQGAGGFQVITSPFQPPVGVGHPQHYVDLNSLTYHYRTLPEPMMVGGTGGLNTSASVGSPNAPHLVLAYAQPQTPSQQQHPVLTSHPAQFIPSGSTPGTTYYTIPVPSPTPPLSLTQPPPSSSSSHLDQPQHHHHPPTVFYTSSVGNPLTGPNPSLTSTSSLKTVPAPFLPGPYQSQPPQQQLHHHSPQPMMVSPSNTHHPSQLTFSYNQPVPYNQVPPVAPSQFVTLQSPYQVKPLGTTLFQLPGGQVVQTPQLAPGLQLQSYQLLRPSGPDMRLVNPGYIRSGLSPLQITTANPHQPRSKSSNQYRPPKKHYKQLTNKAEDYQSVQQTMSVVAPINVSSSAPHSHLQSYSSNRQ